MQVILLEKVVNLGGLGEVVKVKEGYARNYLIPEGKAKRATPENLAAFEVRRAELEQAQTEALTKAQELGSRIDGLTVQVTRKTGVDGRLFGSVTTHDSVEALQAGQRVAAGEAFAGLCHRARRHPPAAGTVEAGRRQFHRHRAAFGRGRAHYRLGAGRSGGIAVKPFKEKGGWSAFFYTRSPIAHGCVFHPCAIGDPRGRDRRPRKMGRGSPGCRDSSAPRIDHCALRAPTTFSARIRSIRAENAVMDKNRDVLE